MKQLFAPNGQQIIGTLENLSARAEVEGWEVKEDGTLEPVWEGSTEVFWDGQVTVTRLVGARNVIVGLTEVGEEFLLTDCEVREVPEVEGDDEASRVKVSVTALGVCVGDRIVQHPTWPEGRLVMDVGWDNTRVTVTYESEECKETFGAADHLVVWRKA